MQDSHNCGEDIGANDVRIVELCSAANAVEAQEICNVLHEEGVQAEVAGASLSNAAGGLPFGEPIAPRVWVRECDLTRAQAILTRRRAEFTKDAADWSESGGPPEWETSAGKPDEGPLPSDVRWGFLNQGFYIAALACLLYGAIWAWQNGTILSKFSATATGDRVGSSFAGIKMIPASGGLDQLVPQRPEIVRLEDVQYAFVAGGTKYYASIGHAVNAPAQVTIHYDPRDPSRHFIGSIAPAGVVWAFALGLGAFLAFVGYQFRSTPS